MLLFVLIMSKEGEVVAYSSSTTFAASWFFQASPGEGVCVGREVVVLWPSGAAVICGCGCCGAARTKSGTAASHVNVEKCMLLLVVFRMGKRLKRY
jgi:hypothetical protein